MCSLPLLFHGLRISRKILVVCEKICYHRGMKSEGEYVLDKSAFYCSGPIMDINEIPRTP